jgi:predicted alpha/beta-fold hydrolase
LLHGLEGSAQSKYILETSRRLASYGLRAVGLNFRSCSGELNRLPRLYHSGETDDLAFTLEWLASRYPSAAFGVVGFSLGGNVLLKYLGERGSALPKQLVMAAAISVPFDLGRGAAHLKRLGGRAYVSYLLGKLQRKVVAKKAMLVDKIDFHRAVSAKDFWEFDDAATAPLHGFLSADDYYQRSSSAGYLDAIRIPTLLIHAENDPFLPRECLPKSAAQRNAHLNAHFTPSGGHVGFVSGPMPWRPIFWAEREAARFMHHGLLG